MNGILKRDGVSESLRAARLRHTVAVNKVSYMPRLKDLTPVSEAISRLFTAS